MLGWKNSHAGAGLYQSAHWRSVRLIADSGHRKGLLDAHAPGHTTADHYPRRLIEDGISLHPNGNREAPVLLQLAIRYSESVQLPDPFSSAKGDKMKSI
jgi:hypothetical protein